MKKTSFIWNLSQMIIFMTRYILLACCLFLSAPSLTIAAPAQSSQLSLEKVSLQLTWKHQFQFAGFYAAIEQGYFAEQGLMVELREFTSDINIVDDVLQGRATFGIGNDSLLSHRLKGQPILLLANYFKQFPLVFVARKGLRTLDDLKGQRLMIDSKSRKSMIVRTAFKRAKLVVGENLELLPTTFEIGPLIRGEVDAFAAFRSNEPFFLEQQGFAYELIELTDGMPMISDINLFTSESQAKANPERTRAFVEAANRGWRYALDHPVEIVELILQKYAPGKNRESLLYEAEKTRQMIMPDVYPIGILLEEQIQATIQAFLKIDQADDLSYMKEVLFDHPTLEWRDDAPHKVDSERLLTPEEQEWLRDHPVIRAYIANAPPYHFWENGPRGISVEILNRIAVQMDFQVEYLHDISWPEALKNIRQHEKLDLILTVKSTPEHKSFLAFSRDYLKLPFVIFTLQDTKNIFAIEDLFTKTIAIEREYALQKRLAQEYPQIRQQLFPDAAAALTAVSKRQADAYIGNLTVAQYHISHLGLNNIKVAAPADLGHHIMAFAARDDWPQLASIIDKGGCHPS